MTGRRLSKALAAATLAALAMTADDARSAPACGDLNASGGVTSSDALLLLRNAVGQPVDLQCAPPSQPAKTGETVDYGAKSDGAQQVGAARSFTDNGDGTITDDTTGLVWEKKDNAGGIHDKDNQYTWTAGTEAMSGTLVTTFLASLNAGSGFAGHKDWRIPNRFELETLLDLEAQTPSIHAPFATSCPTNCTVLTCSCTRVGTYWSSSTFATVPTGAWTVDFGDADTAPILKTTSLYVRAVRGGL
jgi:hypothetical protein